MLDRLTDPSYPGRVEQAIVFDVEAWDANCPQHIPKLVHVDDVEQRLAALRGRIADLEATLRAANVPIAEHQPD